MLRRKLDTPKLRGLGPAKPVLVVVQFMVPHCHIIAPPCQYTTLQRQLAEQAAMSANLACQLQELQSLVPPALLPAQRHYQQQPEDRPHPRRTQEDMPDEDQNGYGDPRNSSWASTSPQRAAAAQAPGRISGTCDSGLSTGSAAATSSPTRLRPSSGCAASLTPREARPLEPPPSHGRSGGASSRLHMSNSPIVAATWGASSRESVHSTLSLLPEVSPLGSFPRLPADPGRFPLGPETTSLHSADMPQLIQEQLLRNSAIQEQISRLGEQLESAAASTGGLEMPQDLVATLAGLVASVRVPPCPCRQCSSSFGY